MHKEKAVKLANPSLTLTLAWTEEIQHCKRYLDMPHPIEALVSAVAIVRLQMASN